MKKKKYQFASTIGFNAKDVFPQVAGEAIEEIRATGPLVPARVVEEAEPEEHPLHPCFEWDDSVAGQKWRLNQARCLIRAVVIEPADGGEPAPAYYRVVIDDESTYQPAEVVVKNIDMFRSAMDQLREKLDQARHAVEQLESLAASNRNRKQAAQARKVGKLLDEAVAAASG